jgi:hypothetical protein
MTCGRQLKRILSHFVGSPNSNPPLVVADRTIIDPDICATSSRELVEACDLHMRGPSLPIDGTLERGERLLMVPCIGRGAINASYLNRRGRILR